MLQTIKSNPFGSVIVAIAILCCLAMLALACWAGYTRLRDHGVVALAESIVFAVGAITIAGWVVDALPGLIRWLDHAVRW